MPCLQAFKWSHAIYQDVVQHIGEFENEKEWKLDRATSESLQQFFLGSKFEPFLIALDTDETRVAERARHAEEKRALKETMRLDGVRELWRWNDDGKDFNEDDYNLTTFPKIPIPYDKMIHLQDMNKDDTMVDTNLGLHTSCILNMGRYLHALHYKIDELQSKCREERAAPSLNITQAAHVLKRPWLSKCDDHVFELPPGENAMELARTPAVIACVFALDVIVFVLILS
jgi:hypothetical protein